MTTQIEMEPYRVVTGACANTRYQMVIYTILSMPPITTNPFGTVVELVGHWNPFVQFVVVNQQLVMIICGSTSMLAFRTITVTEKYGYSRQLPRKMKKFVQKHTD